MEGAALAKLDLRHLLASAEAAPPVDAIDVVGRELGRMVGAARVGLLMANFSGDAVVRMSHVTVSEDMRDGRNERASSISLAGSVYEQVLLTQEVDVRRVGTGWNVLVPVTERGDTIGIVELTLSRQPEEDVVQFLESAAHALAYVLIASRRHTDLFEWAQRDIPFSLAAEIQRRLLPSSYSVEAGPFTLAGWLEPASDVGGDTFDYSIDREYLYASITDAMGHSTPAALLATLTVGSLRNSRRTLASPSEQAALANTALIEGSGADQFVTGLLLRIRLADGQLEIVNAGHPPPFQLRDGNGMLVEIDADLPLGITDTPYDTHLVQLEEGDRLVLVTDGFLERNADGVDIQATLEVTAERHPREIVRELAGNVLHATGGKLRDDATVLCLDWYGPQGRRDATAGASRARATDT
ncbi:MAG TPA: PP2C family protein-serine/threonine phosphatase [Acidimicrobiales bacterium]|nr:PP2C family protein-serine/threonine phosphatase [Acidimicrobiales bacterium]